jgi:demethylmenaquinone methyltransferase/2-methoxy-6-polyprenyl-1,4-benzoquinol methylase
MTPRELAVRSLFSRIASHYDLLNTVLSFGLHKLWRRGTMRLLDAQPGWLCLDVASGTGDFARSVLRTGAGVVALDMTPAMLRVARERTPDLKAVLADAFKLPFADGTFDALTIGFGLRHSREDLLLFVAELGRVLKPGGRLVSLELSHPPNRLWDWLSGLYIHLLLPIIGGFVDRPAYDYLSRSLHGYPGAPELADLFMAAGFARCDFVRLAGGVAAVHVAVR